MLWGLEVFYLKVIENPVLNILFRTSSNGLTLTIAFWFNKILLLPFHVMCCLSKDAQPGMCILPQQCRWWNPGAARCFSTMFSLSFKENGKTTYIKASCLHYLHFKHVGHVPLGVGDSQHLSSLFPQCFIPSSVQGLDHIHLVAQNRAIACHLQGGPGLLEISPIS